MISPARWNNPHDAYCGHWRLAFLGRARYMWPSCPLGHQGLGNQSPYHKMHGCASNLDLSGTRRPCACVVGLHQHVLGIVQGGSRHGRQRNTVSGEYPPEMRVGISVAHVRGARAPGP